MKALVCSKLGNPLTSDGLQLSIDEPIPFPRLSSWTVRIHVIAGSLNFADVLVVQGLYQDKPKLPFIPGSEVSGVITEVGSKVKSVKVGDRVIAITQTGAFAEQVVVHEAAVLKLPATVDLTAAAGLPIAFGTADLALRERAHIKAGQVVLVLGAAGGVGVAAVQKGDGGASPASCASAFRAVGWRKEVAKVVGCRVVAVARGREKGTALKALGADVVIDPEAHPGQQLRALIKEAEPDGVDVVLDTVGGAQLQEALKAVKWGAQILFIGFASGDIPTIAANYALVKNMTLHGVFWGSYLLHKPRVLRSSLENLIQWLAEGKIRIPVSHKFPLEAYREAFGVMMKRQVVGKILLTIGDPAASSL